MALKDIPSIRSDLRTGNKRKKNNDMIDTTLKSVIAVKLIEKI